MKDKNKILLVYSLTLCGIVAWLGAVFLAPFFESRDLGLGGLLYSAFSPICHQFPSRSFFLFGYPLAVCSRCLGIYSGFLLGTGVYVISGKSSTLQLPRLRTFILVSLPIVIDTAGNFFDFWNTSNWIRFAIGSIWGLILPFYFIAGITDAFLNIDKSEC